MTRDPIDQRAALPATLPFLLNFLLSAAIGFVIAGGMGAAIGAVSIFGFYCLMLVVRSLLRNEVLERTIALLWTILRPIIGLILLPPTLIFAGVVMACTFAWERSFGRIALPALRISLPIADAARRLFGFVRGFFTPAELPRTAVNGLLLLLVATLAVGIEVAFYAALVAVPMVICAVLMIAVESSSEPDEG
jgi:hypothetical protein